MLSSHVVEGRLQGQVPAVLQAPGQVLVSWDPCRRERDGRLPQFYVGELHLGTLTLRLLLKLTWSQELGPRLLDCKAVTLLKADSSH